VIDDDHATTDLLTMMLEKDFEVIVAHTGEEGINAVRQYNPLAIILDVLLPDEKGWQICKSIREFSQVPILMLSALAESGMVMRALELGADDFLTKPVSSRILKAYISRLTQRAQAELEAEALKAHFQPSVS